MRKTKSRIINISLFIFVLFVGFIFSEFVFRSILFSENKAFEKLRNPGDYADPDIGENYWKLYYQFDGKNKPPKNPHPLLGWIGFFNPKSYIHNDFRYLKDKRPILLFGDSFAMCVQESKCFQEILIMMGNF